MSSARSLGLSRDDVQRLAELLERRTPGVWKLWGMRVLADQDGTSNAESAVPVADTYMRDENGKPRTFDADLICEAVRLLPLLLAAARRADELQERLDAVKKLHHSRTIKVCMDEAEHDGSPCNCGVHLLVCAGCYDTFVDAIGPWTDTPIPDEIIWPCSTAAALSAPPVEANNAD